MKMRKVLPVMLLAATALTGCAKEVTYAEFHEAAVNVEADKNTKVTVKATGGMTIAGLYVTFSSANNTGTFSKSATGAYVADANCPLAIATIGTTQLLAVAGLVDESESVKYFLDGSAFKTESEGTTWKWNEFGFVTSYKTNQVSITYSYSK